MTKGIVKKIFSVIGNILLYLFLALCIFSVIITIASKKDSDGTPELFGYQLRIVTSDSMAKSEYTDVSGFDVKSLPLRSLLFIDLVPDNAEKAEKFYDSIQVGDVLTFRYVYTSQVTITHRVVSKTENPGGGYLIGLMGDNKASDTYALQQTIDTSDINSPNYIIGRVTGQSYPLGLFLSLLKSPAGIILVIILPCFVIILLEVIKIAALLSAEKRKKREQEVAEKESELEELRKKLAELESQNASDEKPTSASTPDTGDESATHDQTENNT